MHEHHIPRVLTSEEQHRRMLQTPVAKLILSLAAPTVASQLISIIYNTADTYFVSQISTSASAAVGVVFSLQSIIQAYGFGVAMGAGSLISLRLGEKKDRDANMYATSGFLAEFVGGCFASAPDLPMWALLSRMPPDRLIIYLRQCGWRLAMARLSRKTVCRSHWTQSLTCVSAPRLRFSAWPPTTASLPCC